jgi:ribosomal protein S18 acetylase RimI-like enzyme
MLATWRATEADVAAVVALLNDDAFGHARNPPFAAAQRAYRAALAEMQGPDNHVIVAALADDETREIIGCYQLTFIRGLSFGGGLRAQIESVRIASRLRGQSPGTHLMQDAIARAKDRGAFMVQLTTDTRRTATRGFYERLGFTASHHGMKLKLGI